MSTLDLCEKYFGKRDIYALFEVKKDALIKDIKKSYYKLSLQVHPDRVAEEDKAVATEKFKILSKIYQVLLDKEKRSLYDEQGIVDDDDEMENKLTNWLELWRTIFKPITLDAIKDYEKSYKGSEMETMDIKKAYLSGKGCINHIMDEVPFFKVEDEERLQKIIREMIDEGEVPEFKTFTKENAAKRNRRHKKYARESKLADKLLEERVGEENNLSRALLSRQEARAANADNFFDMLAEKYGNDSEEIDIADLGKSKKKKAKQKTKNVSDKLHATKTGKVSKRRF